MPNFELWHSCRKWAICSRPSRCTVKHLNLLVWNVPDDLGVYVIARKGVTNCTKTKDL